MALIQSCSEYRSQTAPLAAAVSRPCEKAKEPIGNPGDSQVSNLYKLELKPLSRIAGEGAERSEAGEGSPGSDDEPSPSQPCGLGPSLSRSAGEGPFGSVMRMIGAGFGVEGRVQLDDPSTEPCYHIGDDVIRPDPESRICYLQREVPIAEVPGDAK